MYMANEFQEYDQFKSSLLPWIICFAATLFFFYEFIQGNMFASIAGDIMQDYHIRADKMAWLSSVYYVSNVLFLFVAGIVLDRFSIKNTLLVAMLLCVASTFLLAYSHSFYVALFSRFVTGIGSAFCFLGPVRLASQWFPPKRMAFVTGAIVTMAMAGGMLAQYPLTKLVTFVGWRKAVQEVGVFGFTMLIVMFFWIKEKPQTKVKKTGMNLFSISKRVYLNSQYIRAAFYASLMNMAIAVFGAMMGTLYLEQRLEVSSEQAAMINGMLFFGAIVGSPLVGWISDKMGLRILPMKLGVLASLASLLAILYFPVSFNMMAILFFLLGLFTSAQVISYALVAESSPSEMIATAVSVVSILTQSGYIVYQNLFSHLLTNYPGMQLVNRTPVYSLDAYQHAAIILPLGLLIALFMLWGLKETYCQRIKD
jgi:MFS family permease